VLGHVQVAKLDVEAIESFYAVLRKCRLRCNGKRITEHRTTREHQCDDRCRTHACKGLANSTIRQIHWILSGALAKAVRWRWLSVNPTELADKPPLPHPNPDPPSAEDAARLLNVAWKDPAWGTLVWLAMTTGARRGELCGLRWSRVDLDAGVVTYRRGIAQAGAEVYEKDTKTHQQRRIALDSDTVEILRAHHDRSAAAAQALGAVLSPDAFVFSPAPDGSVHAGADEDTGTAAAHRPRIDTRVLERLPGRLKQLPLLRVHRLRLARADTEELGVELVGVVDEAALTHVCLARALRVGVVELVHIPAAPGGKPRNRVAALVQQPPQVIRRPHATGQPAAHSDDRDRLVLPGIHFPQPPIGLPQVDGRPPQILPELLLVPAHRVTPPPRKAHRAAASSSIRQWARLGAGLPGHGKPPGNHPARVGASRDRDSPNAVPGQSCDSPGFLLQRV